MDAQYTHTNYNIAQLKKKKKRKKEKKKKKKEEEKKTPALTNRPNLSRSKIR